MSDSDLKKHLKDGLADLAQLRDEIRVKVHLAGMDAKSEWNRLEPRVLELEGKAKAALEKAADEVAQGTREALDELIDALRKLRGSMG
jgi:ElaB/YqjD/DUF883 family membrane-anchored ribosome-binding protein